MWNKRKDERRDEEEGDQLTEDFEGDRFNEGRFC